MADKRDGFASQDDRANTDAAFVPPSTPIPELERYRNYLMLIARSQVTDAGVRDRLDMSGVVQQTFLEAHEKAGQFRGAGEAELAGWLRRILANNLADAMRGMRREKRNAGRERSLERELDQSSARLGSILVSDHSSPSQGAHRADRAVLLADALASLPEAQREVVLLRHWHGWPLAKVAAHLGKTPGSVVGLLQRGLEALRGRLGQHRRNEEL
jgi:RNA polymerase sigma-70 factor (ECF subfamily)